MPLLALENCSLSIGTVKVLRKVSLQIYRGEDILLTGANGSGKSTLLRICAGLISQFDGKRLLAPEVTVGYCGHQLLLYLDLSALENITLFAQLQGVGGDVAAILQDWNLADIAHKPLRQLSQGTQARVALCRAFLGSPRLLVLDEPTASLDDPTVELLGSQLARRKNDQADTTTVIASHDLGRLGWFRSRHLKIEQGELHTYE